MREHILEVCGLQKYWSNQNTPEMLRRGILVRRTIPGWLQTHRQPISAAMGLTGLDLEFEGRDGTGQKTEVPWVRAYSESRSPAATEGWYCVYLFHASGDGVYLSIGHSSTRWQDGEFKVRPDEELLELMSWGQKALGSKLNDLAILTHGQINLGARGRLGRAYEKSCIAAKWYSASSLPTDAEFLQDLVLFSDGLGSIYNAEDLGRSPINAERLLIAAEAAVYSLNGKEKKGFPQQGFGLTASERRAVEIRAMKVTEEELVRLGFTLKNVSRTHSYDFIASKDDQTLIVEVKGSTGSCGAILITKNEIDAHRAAFPNNALCVVHSIELSRGDQPIAQGGTFAMTTAWEIEPERLQALSFQYRLS